MAFRPEEESMLARDVEGTLVPLRQVDVGSYDETAMVTLVHRGRAITMPVPLAAPKRNAQGGIVYSSSKAAFDVNRPARQLAEPRRTTVLDAVDFLMRKDPGARAALGEVSRRDRSEWTALEERKFHPIPTLCHQPHLEPLGNCRVCSVLLGRADPKTGDVKVDAKPAAACWQQVEANMVIFTVESAGAASMSSRVKPTSSPAEESRRKLEDNLRNEADKASRRLRETVGVLSDLLSASARKPDPLRDMLYRNELDELAERVRGWSRKAPPPFPDRPRRPEWREEKTRQAPKAPEHPIRVDLDQCIVCNRCVRSCNDVKGYNVLGRAGKGMDARVGFDVDLPMVDSTCVGCGECMVSCPTGALTFRQPLPPHEPETAPGESARIVRSDELQRMEFRVKDRKAGGVVKKRIFEEVSKAYLLWHEGQVVERSYGQRTRIMAQGDYGSTAFLLLDGEFELSLPSGPKVLKAVDEFILGEMACLAGTRRTVSVHALPGASVLEIGRNFLFQMQRIGAVREALDDLYVRRALELFAYDPKKHFLGLRQADAKASVDALLDTGELRLVRLDPGVRLFERGDRADAMYVVRLGHVKASLGTPPNERVLDYLRPGAVFGEIALVAEVLPSVAQALDEAGLRPGLRSASCAALDHVEAVRIPRSAFHEFWKKSSMSVRFTIERWCLDLLEDQKRQRSDFERPLDDFVARGLHEGQSMLALDLEACTRCDECTKACADSHRDGHNRLTRDGDRFGKYLVASSCRSCHDPLCLVGCPTDAIKRELQSLAIRIDPQACIGCELCANNCPFGNIKMTADVHGRGQKATKAVVCDLCEEVPGKPGPMCVNACPHDAAHRVDSVGLYLAAAGAMTLSTAAAKTKAGGFSGLSLRAAVREAAGDKAP
jgi:Fe-S-cluster-containing hydrogenase component 2